MLLDPGLVVKERKTKEGKGVYESKSWSMCPGSKRSDNRLKRDLVFRQPFSLFFFFFLLIFIGIQRITKCARHRKIMGVFF